MVIMYIVTFKADKHKHDTQGRPRIRTCYCIHQQETGIVFVNILCVNVHRIREGKSKRAQCLPSTALARYLMAAEYNSTGKEPLPFFLTHNLRSISNLGPLSVEQ